MTNLSRFRDADNAADHDFMIGQEIAFVAGTGLGQHR